MVVLGYLSYHPIVRVHLGPLSISPHGVGIAAGFMLGARLLLPQTQKQGIPDDHTYAMLTRAAIGAVIGARLAYVVNHLGDYHSPAEVFEVWRGGISLLGGIFGAILLTAPKMRSERLSFWKLMDAAAPGLALGIFVGRIGDLIVGDHLGKTTHFFLGYRCPTVDTASPCTPGTVVHQTALYDFLLVVLVLALLLRLRRNDHYDGFLITVFGACYATMRILEDFLRADVRRLGLTGSQMTAIVTLLACATVLVVTRRTPRWGRWDERPEEPQDGGAEEGPQPAENREESTW